MLGSTNNLMLGAAAFDASLYPALIHTIYTYFDKFVGSYIFKNMKCLFCFRNNMYLIQTLNTLM